MRAILPAIGAKRRPGPAGAGLCPSRARRRTDARPKRGEKKNGVPDARSDPAVAAILADSRRADHRRPYSDARRRISDADPGRPAAMR
jgi:hypothetical protein